MKYTQYDLDSLHLFPVFQTRDAYLAATGKEAPIYDPTRPVKSWYDPQAASNPRRTLVYDHVLAVADNGAPLLDEVERPYTEPLLISREHAATVNIPIKDFGGQIQEQPTTGLEVPVPLRPITANEELFLAFGGTVAVRNKSSVVQTAEWTAEDRSLLQRIAAKLGV